MYIGDFKNGLKHGKGRWQKGEGEQISVYEGDYVNDKKEGQGVFRWASGNLYEGEFKDDERHGKGTMVWTDGSKYEGDWFRGIQHGYGVISFPDGTQKEGYFDNNVFIGKMKENAGNFTPLDPERIFPVSAKLNKNKSAQKLNYNSLQPASKSKIEAIVNLNRPKPLIKSKYMTSTGIYGEQSNDNLRSSLPQLKTPLMSSIPKASKSANKWHNKRSGSQRRRIIKGKLY